MAIVKMKRLTLLTPLEDRNALLRELQHLGCVALETVEEEGFRPITSDAAQKRAALREVQGALEVLARHAPRKKPLLSAPKEVAETEFWDPEAWEEDLKTAQRLRQLQQTMDTLSARQSQLESQKLSLLPWQDDPLPLEEQGTRTVRLIRGTLPAPADLSALAGVLTTLADTAILTGISEDKDLVYLSLLVHESQEKEALDHLRSVGFALPAWKGLEGTAAENLDRVAQETDRIQGQKEAARQGILALADQYDRLELTLDRAEQYLAREEAADRLRASGSVAAVKGWLPAKQEEAFKALMSRTDCAWSLREPEEEEYPDVPVSLENNSFSRPLNMVTDMYSLPAYGSLDPNPLMAPFFILFYGIMMADMGYGLLMIIAALVAMKRMRPKEGMLSFCQLLLWGGISTFIMGALTGGFFADAPYQLVHMLNPESTWQGLPYLFSPLEDTILVLGGSMVLGFIHLNTGLVISFVQKLKHGDVLGGIFYEGAIWLIFVGAGIMVLGSGMVFGIETLGTAGIAVLVIGAVMLFYGGTRGKKGLGKVTSIFGTLYNELTGWFGDLLSYSRIMALMLAGSVIGQVFNTIASMFGNIILFIIVFIIGHALNFGLNLLGCYVHDLRLQCLEYFGKFYTDGGRPFKPLRIVSKYVEVSNK